MYAPVRFVLAVGGSHFEPVAQAVRLTPMVV
jgi:hypothetical protein